MEQAAFILALVLTSVAENFKEGERRGRALQ